MNTIFLIDELEEKITLLEKRLNILQQQCDSNTTNSKRKQKVFVPNEVQVGNIATICDITHSSLQITSLQIQAVSHQQI